MRNLFKLREGELAFCINLSAKLGLAFSGTIPGGHLHNSDENKPFIDAVLELRKQSEATQ